MHAAASPGTAERLFSLLFGSQTRPITERSLDARFQITTESRCCEEEEQRCYLLLKSRAAFKGRFDSV